MSSSNSTSRVVPAQLSYLAIYNPSLGPTDESVRDQIVFYYSRKLEDERGERGNETTTRGIKQSYEAKQEGQQHRKDKYEEAQENERLRQVGLAQGMVDFVKNFSDGVPLESIETEKSRVVLKEVEPGWWILAAIDLTKLPLSTAASNAKKTPNTAKGSHSGESTPTENVEYSSREVAPAQLLLAQLTHAHRGFLLHHASCLSELWKKHENSKRLFSELLERYWTRFILDWDVLLHGNPATDLYDAVKLAGGGELGIGVGEEEWGSGEREVLEGFVDRIEGLLDLVVGRYGDSPMAEHVGMQGNSSNAKLVSHDPAPWLGNGEDIGAQDGIVFSGIGGVSRQSLVTVSKWMEAIYVHGETAYGVGDNPKHRPRPRRRKRKMDDEPPREKVHRSQQQQREELHPRVSSIQSKAPDLRRKAIENNATAPGIPPPLVSAVERSLNEATAKASDPAQEAPKDSETKTDQSQKEQESGSLFGADKMMKYLSLGYGSSWTLSRKGFGGENESNQSASETEEDGTKSEVELEAHLQELDPTPEVSDEEDHFVQRLEQSIGKFLIGLSGDLENTEFEDDNQSDTKTKASEQSKDIERSPSPELTISNRIFLRTLTMEMSSSRMAQMSGPEPPSSRLSVSGPSARLSVSGPSSQLSVSGSVTDSEDAKGKTSAAASVDGPQRSNITHEKVQVAVYVHQPFIFVFLFQLRTPNLTVPGFYRAIHHTLGPLQKSLLRSTDPDRWRDRVREALGPTSEASPDEQGKKDLPEIYDLVYDPAKRTVRTSIPNIPIPGSLAAEGLHRTQAKSVTVSGSWYTLGIPIGSSPSGVPETTKAPSLVKSKWTRVEALNVHTHILNLWTATRSAMPNRGQATADTDERERTVKTSRGWWVVWMKVLPPKSATLVGTQTEKEAILVRRSQDRSAIGRDVSGTRLTSGLSGSTGRWLLRDQPRSREVSGSSQQGHIGRSGVTNAKGMNEGVGVDARKWVEGLVRLSM
ncbi:hypothetical protein LTR67_007805 [Exophiala xenobiotica]